MPLTSGRMSTEHERKIRKCIIALKRDMDAKELVDYFISEEIFDHRDSELINGYNPNTTSNRNDAFFRLLFASGDRAYSVFLEALNRNVQSHLAQMIENTVLNDGAEGDQGDDHRWIAEIPELLRTRRLGERDISKLAQALGSDWEMIMYDLRLTKTDIDHAKMENQFSPTMQIYSALNRWRVRNPTTATLENYLQTCLDCQQCTTIDWPQVKRIVQQLR